VSSPQGRPVSAAEIDYLSKHPGGFDRDFFEKYMPQLVSEWIAHRDLVEGGAEVLVTLRDGHTITVTHSRVALTWVVFFTEDDEAWLVPHGEVVSVVARRRQGEAPKKQLGFSASRIDEAEG
jgi:hypothetical protein